jgi:peptidoglycan/xylan/chitin deacetylase (PgdA/CDA1 family)
VIRELPRGPFGAYLRTHYRSAPGVLSRFAMGCGAIFMVQRARPQLDSLLGQGAIAETDPLLLEEMVALVVDQGLDVIPLAEVRRRLSARDFSRRFVSFTFDGAYRATLTSVLPLFRERSLPFTLFASTDFLDTGRVPWWMALEGLVAQSRHVRIYQDDKPRDLACDEPEEKRDGYARLFREAMSLPMAERAAHVETLCNQHNIDLAALAAREMLSGAELKTLAEDPLIAIGSQGGGIRSLAALSYDEAKEDLEQSLGKLDELLGERPRHIAYPGALPSDAGSREFNLAAGMRIETAVTAVEGALWPEHAVEPFALPRIALDNDPATLVRALMLSSGAPFGAGLSTAAVKAIA